MLSVKRKENQVRRREIRCEEKKQTAPALNAGGELPMVTFLLKFKLVLQSEGLEMFHMDLWIKQGSEDVCGSILYVANTTYNFILKVTDGSNESSPRGHS